MSDQDDRYWADLDAPYDDFWSRQYNALAEEARSLLDRFGRRAVEPYRRGDHQASEVIVDLASAQSLEWSEELGDLTADDDPEDKESLSWALGRIEVLVGIAERRAAATRSAREREQAKIREVPSDADIALYLTLDTARPHVLEHDPPARDLLLRTPAVTTQGPPTCAPPGAVAVLV